MDSVDIFIAEIVLKSGSKSQIFQQSERSCVKNTVITAEMTVLKGQILKKNFREV